MTETVQAPVVKAVGLSKVFRDFWNRPKAKAVNDIDFEINDGEVVGLLGPNGSGKSTTVKMLLGLLYPTAGQLTIYDRSPREVAIKKRLGYLPEESYLYKYLTALETLEFFGALFNIGSKERRNRAEQLLEMVGMSHAQNRPVGEFSKGMARRIGLAQAMVNDPDLLILDEPTSGLDPLGTREVKDLILLLKKRGKTVLVTSHLLSDVEDICDRVIILYGGRIRATGSLNDLLKIPDSSNITTPLLKPEVTEKLIKILRENLDGDEFRIDHPRKSLEKFFLEVIDQAKEESIETDGVVSGGKIADYLTEDPKTTAVLEDLIKDTKEEKEAEEKAEQTVVEAEAKEKEAEIADKLKDLTTDAEAEAPEPEKTVEEEKEKSEEDLKAANKKLQKLLGNESKSDD